MRFQADSTPLSRLPKEQRTFANQQRTFVIRVTRVKRAGRLLGGSLLAWIILFWVQMGVAQQARTVSISPKALEVLNMPPLEVKDDEDPLQRLKKLRFNAALNEAKDRYASYKRGVTQLSDLMEVGQRVLRAQADLAATPEERVTVLQKQIEIYKEGAANLERQVKEGIGQPADLERLRYNLYSVEIDLQNTMNDIAHH